MAGEPDTKAQAREHDIFAVQDAARRAVVESYRVESQSLNDGHGRTSGEFKTALLSEAMKVGQTASMLPPNHHASVWKMDHTNTQENRIANFRSGRDVTPARRPDQLRMPDQMQTPGHNALSAADFAARIKEMTHTRSKGRGLSL